MKVSAEVEIACSLAAREAQRRGHDLMTVEHLLYALLHDEETARVLRKSGGDVDALRKRVEQVLDTELDVVPGARQLTPTPSRGFQRVLQRAALHVESSGREELKGYNVLIAIFSEPDSPAANVLAEAGVTRYDVVNYVSHGVGKDGEDDAAQEGPEPVDERDEGGW